MVKFQTKSYFFYDVDNEGPNIIDAHADISISPSDHQKSPASRPGHPGSSDPNKQ